MSSIKVVALAGGVGGAKLADGLSRVLPPQDFTVVVNTGDDFEHLGLRICPDLDTVCYTLAGLANPSTGWGRVDECWNAMESLEVLGGPAWFRLGDHDLATHLERTRRLREGKLLTDVTREFCRSWGVGPLVLPISDDEVPTLVHTDEGTLPFQEYFVRRHFQPRVTGFCFHNVERARPAPEVLDALRQANSVVICPSNPWVSIGPILAVSGIRDAILKANNRGRKSVVAVSPIIGGKAVKGPAAKMYMELGIEPSALAVARHYGSQSSGGLLSGFIMDQEDQEQADAIERLGITPEVTGTIMTSLQDRVELAQKVLEFGMML